MVSPQLTAPKEDLESKECRSRGRALLTALGMVVLLLGWTTYTALTDDSFRNWAVRQLPSGLRPASSLVQSKEDPRIAEASTREAALTAKINALQRSVSVMTIDAVALRNANANLIARERATSAKLVIAEKHRLASVAAAQQLGDRLKARVANSVARHLATLPGKVLPAVGATVVVGSTILELRDLCDSMQDMAAMNVAVGLPTIDNREVCGVQIGSVQTIVANAKRNMTSTVVSAMHAAGLAPSTGPLSARFPPGIPTPLAPSDSARVSR